MTGSSLVVIAAAIVAGVAILAIPSYVTAVVGAASVATLWLGSTLNALLCG